MIFCNDMFEVVAKVTKELWPDMPWPYIFWADARYLGGMYGQFRKSSIYISTSLSIKSAVIILIHELAHTVNCYLKDLDTEVIDSEVHGSEWQDCFDKINEKYEEAKCMNDLEYL